jgi:hypothetical protein
VTAFVKSRKVHRAAKAVLHKTFIETEEKHGSYGKLQLKRTAVRRVFGHVKEFDYLGDQIKKNEMGRVCGMYGGEEMCMQGFGGETRGKRPLVRPSRRCAGNIKMCLNK